MHRFKYHCEAKLVRQEGTSSALGRKTLQRLLNRREKKSSCFTQWEECGCYSSFITAKYKAETSTWLYTEVSILHLIVSDAEKQFKTSSRFYNRFWRWDDALLLSIVMYLESVRRFFGKVLLRFSCTKHVQEQPANPLSSSKPFPLSPRTRTQQIPLRSPG